MRDEGLREANADFHVMFDGMLDGSIRWPRGIRILLHGDEEGPFQPRLLVNERGETPILYVSGSDRVVRITTQDAVDLSIWNSTATGEFPPEEMGPPATVEQLDELLKLQDSYEEAMDRVKRVESSVRSFEEALEVSRGENSPEAAYSALTHLLEMDSFGADLKARMALQYRREVGPFVALAAVIRAQAEDYRTVTECPGLRPPRIDDFFTWGELTPAERRAYKDPVTKIENTERANLVIDGMAHSNRRERRKWGKARREYYFHAHMLGDLIEK